METRLAGGRGGASVVQLREAGRDLRLHVPGDARFALLREILLNRAYGYAFPLETVAGGTVIDAGAHAGAFAVQAAAHAARVVALEPNPGNMRFLEENRRANRLENLTPLPQALWSRPGTLYFRATGHSGAGLVDTQPPGDPVTAVSLDALVETYGKVALLKIDIEGAEYDVFRHARRLGDIERIAGEIHYRPDAPGPKDALLAQLREAGFAVRLVTKSALFSPARLGALARHARCVRGAWREKLLTALYMALPLPKPLAPGAQKTPLLFAWRE
jgi:FkbM family methyltransferase